MTSVANWLSRLASLASHRPCNTLSLPVRDHIIRQALSGQRSFILPRSIRLEVHNHRRLLDWLRSEGIQYELLLRTTGDFAVVVHLP